MAQNRTTETAEHRCLNTHLGCLDPLACQAHGACDEAPALAIAKFPIAAEFSALVTSANTRLDLTDEQLARRCHVSIAAIDRWKRGKTVPHPASIASIEAALS